MDSTGPRSAQHRERGKLATTSSQGSIILRKGVTMRAISYFAAASLAATVAGMAPASADVVFTDNTFSDLGNYSGPPSFTSDPGQASITFSNSSNTLQFVSTFNNNTQGDNVSQVLVNSTFTYNPSTQGAIVDIDASVFKAISSNINGGTTTEFGNSFHPTIEQDGVFYIASIAGPGFLAWRHLKHSYRRMI